MVRPIKQKQIHNLQEAIKQTAWKQIAEFGAPALSLRAIARELNITAPAIYNYFPSRDDLVTALIVDAFTSLGDSQKDSIKSISANRPQTRLSTLGLAYRDWALIYPQRYQLIFGTPIPGYEAPADVTLPAAAWALIPLIEALQALYNADKLRAENLAKLTPALKSMLGAWQEFVKESGTEAHIEVLYLAFVIWSRVHGLVTLELGHQTPSFITDPGEIFRREIETIQKQYLS
ncbi:MAG TPA: TetR/AcrR family transcriptional regulator [Anaerolineales bacterium]